MVGVVLYALVDVVLQCLPPYYSPISDAESNLAVGPYGMVMNLNFLGRGAATFCIVVAIASVERATPPEALEQLRGPGLLFLSAAGVSSAVLAFFPTDIGVQGATLTGLVHLWAAGIGFGSAVVGLLMLTPWLRRSPHVADAAWGGLRRAIAASTSVAVVGLVALLLTLSPLPALVGVPELVGLAERLCLVGLLAWVFFMGAAIRRRS